MKVVLHLNEHLQKSHKMTHNLVYYDMLSNLVMLARKKYGLTLRSTNSASLTSTKHRKTEGGLDDFFHGIPRA